MASLTIRFDRDTISDGFYLGTEVLASTDIPQDCLVATKGTPTTPEVITRVATLEDLSSGGIAPVPAGGYVYLRDDSLFPGIVPGIGDQLAFLPPVPALWSEVFGFIPGATYTVDEVVPLPPPRTVVRLAGLPVLPYGTGLSFEYYQGGLLVHTSHLTGTLTLNIYAHEWTTRTHYRTTTNHSVFGDLHTAINKLLALRAQAQSLADNTQHYLDNYAGTDIEDFTS